MTVEDVKSEPSVDVKPVTPPARIPMGTILGEMADAMDSTKKTLDRYKQVTVMQPLRELKEDMAKLTEEELATLKEAAEAKGTQALWDFGHLISSAAYASLSIMFGTYLIAMGEERGKSFIYSGSALLASSLMEHLGGWALVSKYASFGYETVEDTLKATLPLAASITTFYCAPHNLMNLPIEHKELMQGINKWVSWINVGVQTGKVYSSVVIVGRAQRRLTVVEGKITVNQLKVEPLALRNEAVTNSAKQVNDAMKGGIKKMMKGTTATAAG
jgi:hypothetical protein